MVAGAGYAAGRSRANKAAHEQAQEQRIAELEAQQTAPAPAPPPPQASVPAPDDGVDRVGQLTQLKALLDTGALTQAEFDVEKARILAS